VEAVDAGRNRHPGQELGAELLVEEPHARIVSGRRARTKLFR
jgi:hypothetical protein